MWGKRLDTSLPPALMLIASINLYIFAFRSKVLGLTYSSLTISTLYQFLASKQANDSPLIAMNLCILRKQCNAYFIFLILLLRRAAPARWTEDDERKRNNKIKEDEVRDYETKANGGDPFGRLYHHTPTQTGESSSLDYGANIEFARPLPMAFRPQHDQRPGLKRLNSTIAKRDGQFTGRPQPLGLTQQTMNWCFSCSSPWSTLSGDMQQVIRNLFDVRRASYPRSESTREDCSQPKSIDALPRETCSNSYCQTLVLTDHERGKAFTVRGCAEKFGAVDATVLEGRGDNTCKKLHPNIDVAECICKRRRYCYSGADRAHLDRFNSEAHFSSDERHGIDEAAPRDQALSLASLHSRLIRESSLITISTFAIITSMLSSHAMVLS